MNEDNLYDAKRGSERATERTVSIYDRVRGGIVGIAMFTKPSTIKDVEIITGKAVTFIVETARHPELGDTIFVESMNEDGLVRLALPPKVANAIARQRESLTARSRSRAAKILAQERKQRGELPGFMRKK